MKKVSISKIQNALLGLALALTLLSPVMAKAAFNPTCSGGTIPDPRGTGLCLPPDAVNSAPRSINDVILKLINFGLSIAAVIAIAFIVYGGFQYMTAGLNEKGAEKGKKTLTNAVIGLAIIILSYVIVGTVTNSLSDFRNTWRLF